MLIYRLLLFVSGIVGHLINSVLSYVIAIVLADQGMPLLVSMLISLFFSYIVIIISLGPSNLIVEDYMYSNLPVIIWSALNIVTLTISTIDGITCFFTPKHILYMEIMLIATVYLLLTLISEEKKK